MTEIWKDVVGYEEYFQVSSHGRVFSKRSNKILSLHTHKDGGIIFSTRLAGRLGGCKAFKVHRLVAEAFIENPDKKPTVNHIDGNRGNNNIDNLEWATQKEQMRHAIDTKLLVNPAGHDCYNAKLSPEDVKYIREHYIPRHPLYGTRQLGKQFGVHHTKISKVVRGISYKDD